MWWWGEACSAEAVHKKVGMEKGVPGVRARACRCPPLLKVQPAARDRAGAEGLLQKRGATHHETCWSHRACNSSEPSPPHLLRHPVRARPGKAGKEGPGRSPPFLTIHRNRPSNSTVSDRQQRRRGVKLRKGFFTFSSSSRETALALNNSFLLFSLQGRSKSGACSRKHTHASSSQQRTHPVVAAARRAGVTAPPPKQAYKASEP